MVNEEHKKRARRQDDDLARQGTAASAERNFEFYDATAVVPLPMTNDSTRPTQRICRMPRPCTRSHEAVSMHTSEPLVALRHICFTRFSGAAERSGDYSDNTELVVRISCGVDTSFR